MQVSYFVAQRMRFLRQFFVAGSKPFKDRLVAIESRLPPFDAPDGDPDRDEPPYYAEWEEAEKSLQFIGQSCLSMACATLHLYLDHVDVIYVRHHLAEPPKGNWVRGYSEIFEAHADVAASSSPVDMNLLEEVVLTRNSTQHAEDITALTASYRETDLKRYPNPTFISESERQLIDSFSQLESTFLLPTITVDALSLEKVLVAIEQLANWLEPQLAEALQRRHEA
jgi:hypothetical protein